MQHTSSSTRRRCCGAGSDSAMRFGERGTAPVLSAIDRVRERARSERLAACQCEAEHCSHIRKRLVTTTPNETQQSDTSTALYNSPSSTPTTQSIDCCDCVWRVRPVLRSSLCHVYLCTAYFCMALAESVPAPVRVLVPVLSGCVWFRLGAYRAALLVREGGFLHSSPHHEGNCAPAAIVHPRPGRARSTLPDLASPDLGSLDDCDGNRSHTRPHVPDGLVPDGGHPRLCRETLPTIDDRPSPLSHHRSPDHHHGHDHRGTTGLHGAAPRRAALMHARRPT